MDLEGRVALVTGASRRLGRAMARALAEQGVAIAVHYRSSPEKAERTVGELRELGVEAAALAADLTRPAEIEGLFAAAGERFGRLDVLVNSAASFESGRFEQIGVEQWDEVLALNLRAPFLCMQAAARLMGSSPRPSEAPGAITNVADLSGLLAWSERAHHGASKAALLHLTRLAARDLAPGVRVNAVVPGPILPPPGMDPDSSEWREVGGRVPLGRPGRPGNIGQAVVFLASNDYVTGSELVVDGGERLLGAAHH